MISNVIALVALVVAVVSLIRTRRVESQQAELRVRQIELASRQIEQLDTTKRASEKADVRLSLQRDGKNDKFVLENRGPAPAREVTFEIESLEGSKSPLANDYQSLVPVKVLDAGAVCSCLCIIVHGTGLRFGGHWSWKNPDGSLEKRETTLTVGSK